MIRSHINMTLPSVMSRYLLITAAMMSVPPVLPLLEKAMPMPLPQKEAPMTQAMKGWSCRRTTPSVSFWIMERKKVRVNTAKIVFTLNFHPNTRRASNRSRKLMAKYVYWTGNPVQNIRWMQCPVATGSNIVWEAGRLSSRYRTRPCLRQSSDNPAVRA